MTDSPPQGYDGRSILPTPAHPVEMRVFQGGGAAGTEGGGSAPDLLAQPQHRVDLVPFQGGGKTNKTTQEGGAQRFSEIKQKFAMAKQTKFVKAFKNLPAGSAGCYFLDNQGRLLVHVRNIMPNRGAIAAAGGAVDPSDRIIQHPTIKPELIAALREGNEENGIKDFNIQQIDSLLNKIDQQPNKSMTPEQQQLLTSLLKPIEDSISANEIIPFYDTGYVTPRTTDVRGMRAYAIVVDKIPGLINPQSHQGEIDITFDFKKTFPNAQKNSNGTAWIPVAELVSVLEKNQKSPLFYDFYFYLFKLLNIILTSADTNTMNRVISALNREHLQRQTAARATKAPAPSQAAPAPAPSPAPPAPGDASRPQPPAAAALPAAASAAPEAPAAPPAPPAPPKLEDFDELTFRGIPLREIRAQDPFTQMIAVALKPIHKPSTPINPEEFQVIRVEPSSESPLYIVPILSTKDGIVVDESLTIGKLPISDTFFFSPFTDPATNELTADNIRKFISVGSEEYYLTFISSEMLTTKSPFVTKEITDDVLEDVVPFSAVGEDEDEEEGDLPADPQCLSKTIQLSSGLRVRCVREDDTALREAIMNLEFTPDEELLFERTLKLNKPWIHKYITESEPNKEAFYEFWKRWVNLDGENEMLFMTRQERVETQRYLKTMLDAYREYLDTDVLRFLLRKENPAALELLLHPPKETPGFFIAPDSGNGGDDGDDDDSGDGGNGGKGAAAASAPGAAAAASEPGASSAAPEAAAAASQSGQAAASSAASSSAASSAPEPASAAGQQAPRPKRAAALASQKKTQNILTKEEQGSVESSEEEEAGSNTTSEEGSYSVQSNNSSNTASQAGSEASSAAAEPAASPILAEAPAGAPTASTASSEESSEASSSSSASSATQANSETVKEIKKLIPAEISQKQRIIVNTILERIVSKEETKAKELPRDLSFTPPAFKDFITSINRIRTAKTLQEILQELINVRIPMFDNAPPGQLSQQAKQTYADLFTQLLNKLQPQNRAELLGPVSKSVAAEAAAEAAPVAAAPAAAPGKKQRFQPPVDAQAKAASLKQRKAGAAPAAAAAPPPAAEPPPPAAAPVRRATRRGKVAAPPSSSSSSVSSGGKRRLGKTRRRRTRR